ncbi:aromatic-ring-hydroxylating dioxygenase subunit beta [Sphingobium sp.]|uniref:aromatic-ring-hydroxylating dioxygenase subunit beta n=1 Tax=Sphingobium sp. TaxID=1912891 RepID=UPI0028BE4EF6|nr:aromatic-ring-hydroxylating dioxygenase subunit beta [Sphingobium sp.]
MSGAPAIAGLSPKDALDIARDIIEREAVLLEEQRWDEWVDLYAPDCVYWVPAWSRDGRLGHDPMRTLSLIYYASRAGLEDRIVRIRSAQSPAGRPPLRTAHLRSNIRLEEPPESDAAVIRARTTFTNHVFFPRQEASISYFGYSKFTLRSDADGWKIERKKVILQNDYIATYLDICCL